MKKPTKFRYFDESKQKVLVKKYHNFKFEFSLPLTKPKYAINQKLLGVKRMRFSYIGFIDESKKKYRELKNKRQKTRKANKYYHSKGVLTEQSMNLNVELAALNSLLGFQQYIERLSGSELSDWNFDIEIYDGGAGSNGQYLGSLEKLAIFKGHKPRTLFHELGHHFQKLTKIDQKIDYEDIFRYHISKDVIKKLQNKDYKNIGGEVFPEVIASIFILKYLGKTFRGDGYRISPTSEKGQALINEETAIKEYFNSKN